ncbi:MAG: tRNA (adenosine(37)-N6)-threonylcarbamoyltransferase complex ATPase subunit type 1 TsaE, partial [Candidatus Liptonbacteria bacterium]|nr:tRNA (adenosine(37)-N6)-threonylcarbamoyltransferase complex ATPase subunit type 1 TsaE [Candidatus Liptonbacteria bacterium]
RYYKNLYHVDCYRIKTPRELLRHGFAGILRDPTHIVLIEWADKVHRILPQSAIWVRLAHGARESERHIAIAGRS